VLLFTRPLAFLYFKMQFLCLLVVTSDLLWTEKNYNKQYNTAVFEIKTLNVETFV
jgi:hypothetical protein